MKFLQDNKFNAIRFLFNHASILNDATLEAMASKAGRPPPPKLAPNSTGFTYAAVGVEIVRVASSTWCSWW